ncbi:MAG: ABC transporter permease [Flavobacteriales bacterium]|nr:MAG: ABC transporter permease [Flavobacteriales bacterium]
MRNIFLVAQREFLTQVKKKSFIILTILTPLLVVGFGFFISFLFQVNETQFTIQVIDKTGLFEQKLHSSEEVNYIFVSADSEKQIITEMDNLENIDGLLILGEKATDNLEEIEKKSELLMKSKIGLETKRTIVDDLTQIIRDEKIKKLQITNAILDDLDKDFHLKAKNIHQNENIDSDLDFNIKYGLGVGLMYIVFMFIIMYGVRVMRSVLEEKNNRVVEIIISSVKPFELMLGKIIGVTLVALTQFGIWIVMAVVSALILDRQFMNVGTLPQQNASLNGVDFVSLLTQISHSLLELNFPLIIFVFLFFFVFGYVFYSSIYAGIGSAVDNETETQQFTLFAIIPLMVGMYGSLTVVNNPDGPLGFWLSIIPFTSPVAMIARIPFGVPIWQILLSMFLLIISSLLMIFIAGKVYRVGILMHGNKASLKEIIKWIKN